MKLVSGIVDSGFFAQSALSAEVATKDSLGRNISETYLTGVDLTPYQTTAGMTAYQPAGSYLTTADSAEFYTTANESGFLTAVPESALTGYIPYSAYGITLPNSNYEIDSAGQAYKISENPTPITLTPNYDWGVAYFSNLGGYSAGKYTFNMSTAASVLEMHIMDAPTITREVINGTAIITLNEDKPDGTYVRVADINGNRIALNSSNFTATFNGIEKNAYALISNIPDSANFYTTANESGFITGVPDTYLQNTDLEISDNKITGISGVPLAAGGGDVPEGVMAESGLEYNAVDEISGYNGSAFAQYGAEKQWLVHDDTLVHASNSAKYALGVNLSAVAQLLGIDETVLYSGNAFRVSNGGSFNVTTGLSENVSSFNKIVFRMSNGGIDTSEIVCTPVLNGVTFNRIFSYGGQWVGISGAITGNGMSANIGGGNGNNAATCHTAGNWWDYVRVESIYGIGRKQ